MWLFLDVGAGVGVGVKVGVGICVDAGVGVCLRFDIQEKLTHLENFIYVLCSYLISVVNQHQH